MSVGSFDVFEPLSLLVFDIATVKDAERQRPCLGRFSVGKVAILAVIVMIRRTPTSASQVAASVSKDANVGPSMPHVWLASIPHLLGNAHVCHGNDSLEKEFVQRGVGVGE